MKPQETRRTFLRKAALAGAGIPMIGTIAAEAAEKSIATGPVKGNVPVPLTINLFSKHLQFLDYEEMAEATAGTGADGVDLVVRPGGHVLPENVEKDLPRAAGAIRDAGLELTMMTTAITDADDPFTERILKTASELEIRYYRMGWYPAGKREDIGKNLGMIRKKMGKLAGLNRKYGIHGAYQNHAGDYFGAPVWDLWYVIRDLDPEWTGCQYDIRHATVEGANSWYMGLEMLKDHIRCLVIKDFHWEFRDDRWSI
ncbi:MAG: sugar phosphate isomerase/epimerase, partial [Bacteroidetes bacterium]